MLYFNLYTKQRQDDVPIIQMPDFELEDSIRRASAIGSTNHMEYHTYSVLALYILRSLIASGQIGNSHIEVYVDGEQYNILSNGRFTAYPPNDIFEECIDLILKA